MEEKKKNLTSGEGNGPSLSRVSVFKWILRVIQGAIIGAGAILPGISGGVLCVVFGIYQPMMALLAHPLRTFRKYAGLLLPVLIGWALGFLLIAKLLALMFSDPSSSNPATWLFVGLIAGMMPQLYREAGKQGRTKKSWISLIVSTVLVLTLLAILHFGTSITIQPNLWWFFVCGLLWGVSLVVPGLSSSSLLLFLGLYQPMNAGIAALTTGMWGQALEVIVPMLIGIFIFIFVSARAVNYMFDKHYSSSFHAVLGFVIASTIAVLFPATGKMGPDGEIQGMVYTGDLTTIFIWVLCFAAGFVIAWLMDRLSRKVQRPELEEEKSEA